jgi:hypothetical protein
MSDNELIRKATELIVLGAEQAGIELPDFEIDLNFCRGNLEKAVTSLNPKYTFSSAFPCSSYTRYFDASYIYDNLPLRLVTSNEEDSSGKELEEIEVVEPETVNSNVSAEGDGNAARVFATGASRNSDEGKLDFEGFLSPTVLKAYAEYMHQNRFLEDGSMRDSDNWQKGIPKQAYMKSMWRHFFDTWSRHRGINTPESQVQNLCGLMFNVAGMLHEVLKDMDESRVEDVGPANPQDLEKAVRDTFPLPGVGFSELDEPDQKR